MAAYYVPAASQQRKKSPSQSSRPALLEISNEGARARASSITRSLPAPALHPMNHIGRSESTSSQASTSSVAESPTLWFSPLQSRANSIDWGHTPVRPSRKGKERAIDETPSRFSKHLVDLETGLEGQDYAPSDGLGIGIELGGPLYEVDTPKQDQDLYSSIFRRRTKITSSRTLPTISATSPNLSSLLYDPLESSTSSVSSNSSSSSSSTMPFISSPFSTIFGKKQYDYLDRLRVASSPNRRRRRLSEPTAGLVAKLPLPRSVNGLIGLLLLAGTFLLLGFTLDPSRAPDDLLSPLSDLQPRLIPRSRFASTFYNLLPTKQTAPIDTTHHSNFREEPHRDTLILYRILGNDLPPRHVLGQTLRNLRFMLEKESNFTSALLPLSASNLSGIKKVEKYYILNRISSIETLNAIRALLMEFRIPQDRILTIPFEWSEYERRAVRWDGGVAEVAGVWNIGRVGQEWISIKASENKTIDAVSRAEAEDLSKVDKRKMAQGIGRLRAIDFTYQDKNLYAINNNGGRNFALKHGRSLPHARWILPLDGNCFFTPPAMLSLINNMEKHGEGEGAKSYVVIPMARLLDNKALLPLNTDVQLASRTPIQQAAVIDGLATLAPEAPEEPQVGFRFDATESYQLGMRYGRRSKLELLWRLGVVPRSRNLDRRTLPWEQSDREFLTSESFACIKTRVKDVNQIGFMHAGWVYRLFSGDQNQEIPSKEANSLRNMNRIRGIVGFLERLDEKLTRGHLCSNKLSCGFDRALTWGWNLANLQQIRQQYRSGQPAIKERIRSMREDAFRVQQDLNLAIRLDPTSLNLADPTHAAKNISTLALAGYLSDSKDLVKSAATIIMGSFLFRPENVMMQDLPNSHKIGDGLGYTFPHVTPSDGPAPLWHSLLHSEIQLPYNPAHFDPLPLLDALRLIEATQPDLVPKTAVTMLFSAHLAFLLTNREQLNISLAPITPDDAARYDIQIAALAGYLDDVRLLNRVKNRAVLRSPTQQLDDVLQTGLRNVRALDSSQDFGMTVQFGY